MPKILKDHLVAGGILFCGHPGTISWSWPWAVLTGISSSILNRDCGVEFTCTDVCREFNGCFVLSVLYQNRGDWCRISLLMQWYLPASTPFFSWQHIYP